MKKKMFIVFKSGKQKELVSKAIFKAGSERKLAKQIAISKSVVSNIKLEKINMSNIVLERISDFLNLSKGSITKDIVEVLPSNWGQIKGGKELIRIKRSNGTFELTVNRLRKATTIRMVKWHAFMKNNHTEEYYKLQYSRFKKIKGGYGEKKHGGLSVRNKLEREIAEFLESLDVDFLYEPYINVNGKAYFPDFIVDKNVIEVTAWKHLSKEKIDYLNNKIKNLKSKGYKVYFFIPDKYRKFYKELETFIISDLSALQKIIALVA